MTGEPISRAPTLRDVAAASGVSRATVSFVLNDTPGQVISAATRERVLAAARSLRYTPHPLARALREGASRIVLLDLGDLRSGNALRSYVDGMRQELAIAGHTLLVRVSDSDDGLAEQVRPRAVVRPADGYLTGRITADGGWADGLAAHTLVQIEHLVSNGHRSIAFAVPSEVDLIVTVRGRLVSAASERLGIPAPVTVRLPDHRAGAGEAIRSLRAHHPEVSAIAAFDDATALRVLAAFADLDLHSPRDLAVIGFDDAGQGEFAVPALTSVRIDAAAFGRRAARSALGLAADEHAPLPATIIRRASA